MNKMIQKNKVKYYKNLFLYFSLSNLSQNEPSIINDIKYIIEIGIKMIRAGIIWVIIIGINKIR